MSETKDDIYETFPEDEYDEEFKRSLQEAAETQTVVRQRRMKTYLNSEVPVRPCTDSCPHRGSCKDFLSGRVEDNDLCKPELRQIKKWQVAFRKGDLEPLKDDIGAVAGTMATQLGRLMEAVIVDGVVINKPIVTKTGEIVYEKVSHPALQTAARLMKDLGIDLNSFHMTPKAQQDAGPPQVQVNVGISADEVHARFQKRYAQGDKE